MTAAVTHDAGRTVLATLSGDPGPEPAAVAARYAGHMERLWCDALAALRGGGIGAAATELDARLDPAARRAFLLAPETAHRLLCGDRTDVAFHLEALAAAAGTRSDRPIWTALGDLGLAAAGSGEPDTHAPRLRTGLPVDTVSPHGRRTTGYAPMPWEPMTPQETAVVLERLDRALAGVRAASPVAAELIGLIRVLVVKKHTSEGNAFGSYSSERYAGRAAFTNAHLDWVDDAVLANALVHESIHSFLYLVELWDPIVADADVREQVRVVSPWSGRELALHSFVHACLVWFGLERFWSRPAAGRAFGAERARSLYECSRAGFGTGAMAEAFRAAAPHLEPGWRWLPGWAMRAGEPG